MKKKKIIVIILILGTLTYLITKPINNVYLSNDTYLSSICQEILGIEEDDCLKSDSSQDDEVYLEIINSYMNNELTDDKLLKLCVEYPYLNLYIEQYYIENINTIKNDDNSEKITQMFVLNRIANDLIDEGVDEVTTIETIGENRLEITVKYNADESANEQTTEENKSIVYGEFIRGADAGNIVLKSAIESEINEIKELESTLNLGEELESLKVLPSAFYSIFGEDGRDSTKFVATPKTYQLVDVIYTLDKIMDPNTSQEEKNDLQMYLIQLANPNVDIYNLDDDDIFGYGDAYSDNVLNSKDYSDSGINYNINRTYDSANIDGAIDRFIEENYFNDDGTLNMNRIVEDYNEYEDMFLEVDTEITAYRYQ